MKRAEGKHQQREEPREDNNSNQCTASPGVRQAVRRWSRGAQQEQQRSNLRDEDRQTMQCQ